MPPASDNSTRRWLALGVVVLSVLAIAVLSVVAIGTAAGGASRAETSRLVFSSVLPLLGTWVGTVLAFYFARENLAAATQSTLALQGRVERETPARSVMIPEVDFIAYDLGTGETAEGLRLAQLHAKMREISPPSRRLPIRNPAGAVLYVLHDSTLVAFTESVGQTTTTLDKTLGDLLQSPEFNALVDAIAFVGENATVADARKAMVSVKNCNDVFVTASGNRDERAIGWLTNTLLAGVQ